MALPINRGSRDYYSYFQDNVAYLNVDGDAIPIGRFVGGQYNSAAQTYADGDPVLFQFTSAGRLMCDASLTVEGDVQIGAVEIKDATADTRAVVKTDGTNNALVVMQNVPPTGTYAAPQAYGQDVAGSDGYTTIVTASVARHHLSYSLQGSNDAVISLDGGTTDAFYLPANSAGVFDNITIDSAATVQGKNAVGGSNYTDLIITIW